MVQIYRPNTINGKTPVDLGKGTKTGRVGMPDIQAPMRTKDYDKVGKKVGLGGAIQQKIKDLDLVEKDKKEEKRKKVKPIVFELKK